MAAGDQEDIGRQVQGLQIGQGHLAESYLAPAHPHDVRDRRIVGRDPIDGDGHEEARA